MSESQQKRKDDLHHLKNALRDAPYCCKKIIYLNQEIERMEYELTGMARHSIPMTKEQERSALPNALRDAPYCCKKIIYLNQEIERMEYELTGMARHSIPMTKEQERSALPMPRFHGGGMTLVERIAEIDAVKDERSYYEKRLRECSVIEWLDPEQQELIFKVFFGMTLVERIAEIDAVKDERSYYEKRLRECSVIEWLDPEQQELIFKVFFLKTNQWELAEDYHFSRSALIRKVNSILRSVIS